MKILGAFQPKDKRLPGARLLTVVALLGLLLPPFAWAQSHWETEWNGQFHPILGVHRGLPVVHISETGTNQPVPSTNLRAVDSGTFYPAFVQVDFTAFSPSRSSPPDLPDTTLLPLLLAASVDLKSVWMTCTVTPRNAEETATQLWFIGDLPAARTQFFNLLVPFKMRKNSDFSVSVQLFVGDHELITNFTPTSDRRRWATQQRDALLAKGGESSSPPQVLLLPSPTLPTTHLHLSELDLTFSVEVMVSAAGEPMEHTITDSPRPSLNGRVSDALRFAHFVPQVVDGRRRPCLIQLQIPVRGPIYDNPDDT